MQTQRHATTGSLSAAIQVGVGINLIKITGHIHDTESDTVLKLMQDIKARVTEKQTRKIIGFQLNSGGADFSSITMIVDEILKYRKDGFSFYVLVRRANHHSSLIVACADQEERYIYDDGEILIHDGILKVAPHMINVNRQINLIQYTEFGEQVEFYRKTFWSKTGLQIENLSQDQRKEYDWKSSVLLRADDCLERHGFKRATDIV